MLYVEDWADRYLDRLFDELDRYHITSVDTIYVGGGTPSALTEKQLERLLTRLAPLLAPEGEFTVEANIENATKDKLTLMRRLGVNRLSFGIQSFDAKLLTHMNRRHDEEQTRKAVASARELGFRPINGDLIYDLPGQTMKQLQEDIDKMLSLNLEHISTYSLSVHPHTVYGLRHVKVAASDTSRKHYDLILTRLRERGYRRYEVSNYALPGYEGRHNLTYWNNEFYYGIGLGASGYLPGLRYTNTKNFRAYLSGVTVAEREDVTLKDEETYYLMLKLRLEQGFLEKDFQNRFQYDFKEKYVKAIRKLTACGWLQSENGRWYASDEGLLVLDRLVVTLLQEN